MEITREQLLKPRIVKRKLADDSVVYFRVMSGAQRCAILTEEVDEADKSEWTSRFLAPTLCDENGKPLFENSAELYAGVSSTLVDELFKEALIANGIGEAGSEEAKKS